MKLAFFDDFKLGVVKGDGIVDVSAVVKDIPHICPGTLMNGLIARFDAYRGKIEAAVASGKAVPLSGVRHPLSGRAIRWCCPTCRRRSSRVRRKSPW